MYFMSILKRCVIFFSFDKYEYYHFKHIEFMNSMIFHFNDQY